MVGNLAQFKNAISSVSNFGFLSNETPLALAKSAIHRNFEAGQVIYIEGEPAESFLLESGWVKAVRMTRAGREQAMMFLRPVEVF